MNEIKTSNIDYAAYLTCKGLKILDMEVDSKGIAHWIFENIEEEDFWFLFLRGDSVPAKDMASAIRNCKRLAYTKK